MMQYTMTKPMPIQRKMMLAKLKAAMDEKTTEFKTVERYAGKYLRREICDDLKWAMHIRYIETITEEQMPEALEYIDQWTPIGLIKRK